MLAGAAVMWCCGTALFHVCESVRGSCRGVVWLRLRLALVVVQVCIVLASGETVQRLWVSMREMVELRLIVGVRAVRVCVFRHLRIWSESGY